MTAPTVTAQGAVLEQSPDALGELRRSDDAVDDVAELQHRLSRDGYLFLPGYLDPEQVRAARTQLLPDLARLGALAQGSDPRQALAADEVPPLGILSDLAAGSPALMRLLYGPRMLGFFAALFGEPVRHYDFTWLRATPPGRGTKPHGDSVFMNRGTTRQLTAWVPLGDIDRRHGGLVMLEGSHRLTEIRRSYGDRDVDTFLQQRSGDCPLGGLDQRESAAVACGSGLPLGDHRLCGRRSADLHHLHAAYESGQQHRPGTALLRFPVPAGQRAGGSAVGGCRAERSRSGQSTRRHLLKAGVPGSSRCPAAGAFRA